MIEFSLLDCLEQLVVELADMARSRQISLQSYVDPDLPAYFESDSVQLFGTLKILVRKAIEFASPGGQVYVAAECASMLEESGLCTPVRFQIDSTSYQPPQPDTFAPVRRLGSKLHSEARAGVGVRWFFRMDLQKSEKRTERPVFTENFGDLRIFVVSNEPQPNRVVQNYMRYAGIQCDGAPTARETLLELSRVASVERFYHLITVAQPIPDIDLFDFAHLLRDSSIDAKTKLVFIDEYFDEETKALSLSNCFDAYLAKPFRQQELFDATTELLGIRQTLSNILPEQTPTILVAEDNAVNQKMILFQLRRLGYYAEAVDNGYDAIQALRDKAKYVLILMDLAMPVLNGWDAAAEIRSRADLYSNIPIVALTTDNSADARDQCFKCGINDVAYKPIKLEALRKIVEQYIRPQLEKRAS